jgi:predicted flavoprotein YhiN
MFFEKDLGLQLSEEKETNKVFPSSNSAREVRDRLLDKATALGVKFVYEMPVKDICKLQDGKWKINAHTLEDETKSISVIANKIIIASGGLSIPAISGKERYGYSMLKSLGHSLIDPYPTRLHILLLLLCRYPALTPLLGPHVGHTSEPNYLKGISVNVDITAVRNSERITSQREGFLFTHRGFSGPSVLDVSHLIVQQIERKDKTPVSVLVNWASLDRKQWLQHFADWRQNHGKGTN